MQRPNIVHKTADWRHAPQLENQLLLQLSEMEFGQLEPYARVCSVDVGTVVFGLGGAVTDVYFPLDCVVSLTSAPIDEERVDIALVGSDGFLAAAPAGAPRSIFNAVVQVPGRLMSIRAEAFHAFCDANTTFRHLIERWQTVLLFQSQQVAACNAVHHVEMRLCRWLLQFHQCTGLNMLPVTQEMLASMLGVQRTTVTLVAHRLKSKGILRQRRGRIELLNLAALEDSACDCHLLIRRVHDSLMSPTREPSPVTDERPPQAG